MSFIQRRFYWSGGRRVKRRACHMAMIFSNHDPLVAIKHARSQSCGIPTMPKIPPREAVQINAMASQGKNDKLAAFFAGPSGALLLLMPAR